MTGTSSGHPRSASQASIPQPKNDQRTVGSSSPTVSVQPHRRADRSAMWSTNAACWSPGTGSSPSGTRCGAHVAHEQRRPPAVAAEAPGRADDGVVDRRGERVVQARRPHRHLVAAQVADGAGDPVVVDVHHLEHVRLAADDDPFERRPRLAVGVAERLPFGGARHQLVDRRRHGSRAESRFALRSGRARGGRPLRGSCAAWPVPPIGLTSACRPPACQVGAHATRGAPRARSRGAPLGASRSDAAGASLRHARR